MVAGHIVAEAVAAGRTLAGAGQIAVAGQNLAAVAAGAEVHITVAAGAVVARARGHPGAGLQLFFPCHLARQTDRHHYSWSQSFHSTVTNCPKFHMQAGQITSHMNGQAARRG